MSADQTTSRTATTPNTTHAPRRRRRSVPTNTIERAVSRSTGFVPTGRGGRECAECSGIGGHYTFCDKTR
jgi:hypothetical protein